MILDSFKLEKTIIQIQYSSAFLLWDRAGAISRELEEIWSSLTVSESQPQQQVLTNKEVSIQTGFSQSTLTLRGERSFSELKVRQITESFEVWRRALELTELNRVGTRTFYAKDFDSSDKANEASLSLNLVRWPDTQVFGQPLKSGGNAVEVRYRFQDEEAFSVLGLKTEHLRYEAELDPMFFSEPEIKKTKNRMIIDFDRASLKPTDAMKFRMSEWLKGYQHLFRRDVDKVIKSYP